MTYYEHALMSIHKFGSVELFDNYLGIHKFIDSTKLILPNLKHRLLLHNTYGAERAIEIFGDYLPNGVLVRDIVFEHCREDLDGAMPDLAAWINGTNLEISCTGLKDQIDQTLYERNGQWLNEVTFNQSWMFTPRKSDIKWLLSEERTKLEKQCKSVKKITTS